jgi:hypothetical protein
MIRRSPRAIWPATSCEIWTCFSGRLRLLAAAQDDVGVLVAGRAEDGRLPLLGHGHEDMWPDGGMDGVDCDLHRAIGGVLEADRAGEAGGELAMALALGGACADGAPADQVGDVLWADEVEELSARGDARFREVEQQLAGKPQSLVDLEAAVEVRVIDQSLPADRGARLLEVDPHDHHQVWFDLIAQTR